MSEIETALQALALSLDAFDPLHLHIATIRRAVRDATRLTTESAAVLTPTAQVTHGSLSARLKAADEKWNRNEPVELELFEIAEAALGVVAGAAARPDAADDARDAARYRWIMDHCGNYAGSKNIAAISNAWAAITGPRIGPKEITEAIDAAIDAAGAKP